MKRLLILVILFCLLSGIVAADCTTTEDIKYCTGTVDLDTETFIDTGVIVWFNNVDFTISETAPNASNIYDGSAINISMTAASFIFEDSSFDFAGTDGVTPPSEATGGAGGNVYLTLNVGSGTIGLYDSDFNLTAGNGADGGTKSGNYASDGGNGGEIIISFTASRIYINNTSNFIFSSGNGGDGKASTDGLIGSAEEAEGGEGGVINITVNNLFESDGCLNFTTGFGGDADASVGQNDHAAADGADGGSIEIIGESISLGDFNFIVGVGGNAESYANGVAEGDAGNGGSSGDIIINATTSLYFTSVGIFDFGIGGAADCAYQGTGTGSGTGGYAGDLSIYFNHSYANNSELTINLGDGGDGAACGDDTASGGNAGDLLFSGTDFKLTSSNFTINAGVPGDEDGSNGDDGDMSSIKFQSSVLINNSNIQTIQNTGTYYCNAGGVLWIIGDYFNISSSDIVMNASKVGGDHDGTVSDCYSRGGGDLIVRVNSSTFEDGSLTLTSGPGGPGTGGVSEDDADSGPLTFNVSVFNMDNFTLTLGTGDVTVSQGGSVVGNMEINFDNITWNNVTFNWDEGDPTSAVLSIVNITEIAIIDNNSLINFTTNNATVSTDDYWYFWGWQTKIFDTQLTNTSNTDLQYTVKTEGWDYQDEHNYLFLDNLTCSGIINVTNNTVSSIVHNRTQNMAACTVTWETGITEENESVAEWGTRIFNVTPRGNQTLDWPNDGWNCYTDFEVYNSSVVNATSDNFAGAHTVGETIWCELNLSLAADFDFARNKSTTAVAPYPYNWNLYVGDQNATWTPVPLTDSDQSLAINSTAAETGVVFLTYVLLKNITVNDWDTRNNISGTSVDLDVKQLELYWREEAPAGGSCTCFVTYAYTNDQKQNSSDATTSSGTYAWHNFTNPNSTLEVNYTELWCKENQGGPGGGCFTTHANVTGNWSYKPDWYDTELNGSVISYFRGGVNYWEQYECTEDTCLVPINFTSNSSESLWNLSNLFVEWGQSSAAHGDYQVPIVITSDSSGMFSLSNWVFTYYNDTEIEMNVTSNTSITRIINISHSKINFSQAYDYIEFYPTTLSSKNVTPWGQNRTFPFYNITYDANRDFELAVLLNETLTSCMELSISKDNTSNYQVLSTTPLELTNMTVNQSTGFWINLDLNSCNRSALHALYTIDLHFDTCCDGCVACW